jgi:glycosyltransferase involved in cell wall biosynthesis
VSRLEKRKRHEWCIRALEDLLAAGEDVELTLIGGGGGTSGEELRRVIAEKSAALKGRLTHRENVTAEELELAFAQCDVFLFPSLGEGFGIPVIEAAVRGVPCVVSDGSALAELKTSYTGESFSPTDYPGFLTAIRKVVGQIESYSLAAWESRGAVAQRYKWGCTAKEFLRGIMQMRSKI